LKPCEAGQRLYNQATEGRRKHETLKLFLLALFVFVLSGISFAQNQYGPDYMQMAGRPIDQRNTPTPGTCPFEPANPPTPGVGVMCFDATTQQFMCSQAGGAYVPCIGSGGGGTVGPGTINHLSKFITSTTIGDAVCTDDGITPTACPLGVSLVTNALYTVKPNNGSTGTTVNLLVARDSAGNAQNAQPTDTNNLIGISGFGTGTTGNVSIAYSGQFPCMFDNQTAIRDWVILGSGSQCHDAGATEPAGVQNIGRVSSVNSGAGTLATIDMGLPDVVNNSAPANGTITPCASFPGPITYYTAAQIVSCDILLTTDGAGGLSGKSVVLSGTTAGFLSFGQGTAPTFCPTGAPACVPANSSAWHAPVGITTSFDTAVPAAPGTVGQVLTILTAPDSTHITLGWGTAGGSGTVTSFSAGNASPLFTTNVATPTTTPALTFSLSTAAAHTFYGNNTGSTATPAFSAITTADLPDVTLRRICMIVIGADNGSALVNADIAPQKEQCIIPFAATVREIDVVADAGTPSVIVGVRHCTASPCASNYTVTNLLSGALTAITGGGPACSKTGATAGLDTFTTCAATLQNTTIAIGDYIETVSATAGGTAKRLSISIYAAVN
jgi:hypothetical protein